jgi:predicted HTH domain antitoxin
VSTRQIVLDVPEAFLADEHTDAVSFGEELRTLAAVKLYELGRLSAGRAAELAGVSPVELLTLLERYRSFPFAAELGELERRDG